ncbi:unnamed protein product [Miscanthus lutarioriparius]|uniref:Uncharacterized protein n=1 Tax=Miscanthus lutarioriparius TaxID=422564 RepID=A0A811NAD3_9POAL|nr:unnamed protein product [Miscanthus lutarioriparius]
MTEIRGRQNNGSKSQQAGVKHQKWPQTKRPTPPLTLAPPARHPSGSRTVLPSFPARPPPIALCAPINADPVRKTAGFLVASDAARIALLIRLFKASCCVLYSAIPAVAPPKQHMDAWFRLPGSGRDASLRSRPCRLEQRLPASTIQCWGYFLHCSPFIKNYWSYFLHGYFLHENCRISATLTTVPSLTTLMMTWM